MDHTETPARHGPLTGKALAHMATLESADIVLPTTDGREIRPRRGAKPIRNCSTLGVIRIARVLRVPVGEFFPDQVACTL